MENRKESTAKAEFAGPYRLMETLGKGGLATVKIGLEFASGTVVAVKIIDKEKLANPREQISMAREITIMKLLKHKNILRLYDIYENEEKIFLILDLYEGGDLYGYLTQKGALPPDEALHLFKKIIAGVEYCHKNMIVHRDLKPENILLSADKKQLVISDFGLSTGMQGSRNLLKTRCGTVHYISPEVAKGDLYVGMASDVWSCGIILYAMVTATLPFDGPSSVAVLKKIVRGEYHMPSHLPKELQDIIRLMLTGDPKERITIPQIKQTPWYLGLPDDTPRKPAEEEPPDEPYILTLAELEENSDVLDNLKLLGWEESELMNDLLSKDKNIAKVFHKLLMEHKSIPLEEVEMESPKPIDKKVFRRRSVGAPTRVAKIGAEAPKVSPAEIKRLRSEKRSSQRVAVRRSERPISRGQNRHSSRERSATVGSDDPSRPTNTTHHPHHMEVHTRTTISKKGAHDVSSEKNSTTSTATSTTNTESTQPCTVASTAVSTASVSLAPLAPSVPKPEKGKAVVWGISPTLVPDAKHYQVGSTKNITQLLESLQHCFADIGQYDLSAKQTKNGIRVKARQSGKRHGAPVVTLNLHRKEDGETELILKGGKSKEQFKELAKKVEETLVV